MSIRRLLARVRGSVTLMGVRTIVLLIAASLSIGGWAYNYLKAAAAPTHGELLTVVRDVRQTPLSDARIAVFTLENAPVTSFVAAAPPGGPRIVKEGTYRLRVSHPRYVAETRMVQVIAGHTSEVRFTLGPRIVAAPRPPVKASPPEAASPGQEARRLVSEGVDSLKRIFQK